MKRSKLLASIAGLTLLCLSNVQPSYAKNIGVNWHPRGQDVQSVANLLKAKGFNHLRFDLGYNPDFTPNAETLNIATVMKNNGISMTGVIYTAIGYQVQAGYCPGDIPSAEQSGYDQARKQVDALKNLISDYEMQNEVTLYPNMRLPQNPPPYVNASTFNTPCSNTMAAVLRGINRAIKNVASTNGKQFRSILGATSDGSVGFLKFAQQKNVGFDIVGFHFYPRNNQNLFSSDPWYGPQGALGLLTQFGKPIHVNEINCGETYDAGFTNYANSPLMATCVQSLNKHLSNVISTSVESIDLFEIFDRNGLSTCATGNSFSGLTGDAECRFGLMYNLTSAKPSMDTASNFAKQVNSPPVNSGGDRVITDSVYVTGVYELLFGREPSVTGEVNSWLNAFNAGTYNRISMQKFMLTTTEYLNRKNSQNYSIPASLNNLSRPDYVTTLYRVLLQREPDTNGLNSWVATTLTKSQLLQGFLSSTEYVNLYK